LQAQVIRIGEKVVRHEGDTRFQRAEALTPRRSCLAILAAIRRLPEPVPAWHASGEAALPVTTRTLGIMPSVDATAPAADFRLDFPRYSMHWES
jgi:hypothetical protein